MTEETVEITPNGSPAEMAKQLLAVAESADNDYTVDDVRTTTSGPMGLAFLVPLGLYEAWSGVPTARTEQAEEVDEQPVEEVKTNSRRRGRPPRDNSGKEE